MKEISGVDVIGAPALGKVARKVLRRAPFELRTEERTSEKAW